jgi:hypothetical protein
MNYHIKLVIDPHFQPTGIGEQIVKKGEEKGLIILIDNSILDWREEYRGLNSPHSFRSIITTELGSEYCQELRNGNHEANLFVQLMTEALIPIDTSLKKTEYDLTGFLSKLHLNPLSVYYFANELKFHFTQVSADSKIMNDAWAKMIDIISKAETKDTSTLNWLESMPTQKNKMYFLVYNTQDNNWKLIDRQLDATLKLSTAYRKENNDERVRKPYIVFNEDNYNEYLYFDNNQWQLLLEKLAIIMTQPNDISLYVRLADKNLILAEAFFKQELKSRSERLYMPLITDGETIKFYDYFETVIAAIIFSYTSLTLL